MKKFLSGSIVSGEKARKEREKYDLRFMIYEL